ncbi:hypothetical protein Y032_0055g2600 [Ancylostoma ceylanicum]|uniref:Uncharacterized protein n=1 Tax=Ancylostoma ceylanicum TaxID=53326 RepID=A0A016U5V5_9BILA|nr:hypothetical protein Y032_0055g2600 [Ancylostoma ceylanicum]
MGAFEDYSQAEVIRRRPKQVLAKQEKICIIVNIRTHLTRTLLLAASVVGVTVGEDWNGSYFYIHASIYIDDKNWIPL